MTVYFISKQRASLTLNGIYVGIIDNFERKIELCLTDDIMAQIIPDDNRQPLNFFINEKFLSAPPPFVKIYRSRDEAVMYFGDFESKDGTFSVIAQTLFYGFTVTVFRQGKIFLCVDGRDYQLFTLDGDFSFFKFCEVEISGFPFLAIEGHNHVFLLSQEGKKVFYGEKDSVSFSPFFTVCQNFKTCRQIKIERTFSYDGQNLVQTDACVTENAPLLTHLLPFAFFECVLYGGDFKV